VSAPDDCYRAALRILNHRFNSAVELKRKLRAKGFDRESIEPTIVRLTDEKWLDDARYAGAYVRTRLQKRIGKLRVRRELIAAGVAGRVRVVRTTFAFDLATERGTGDTRLEPALDGGSLMDVGCYCISGLRLVAGEPARARGEQVVGPSGVDVVFTGALSFADEVVGHFDCSFVVPRRAGLEVVGEEATILVPDPFTPRTLGIDVVRPGTEPERIPIEPDNSYRLELENVSAAILGEAPLLIGREDALGQARTLDELYRSAA